MRSALALFLALLLALPVLALQGKGFLANAGGPKLTEPVFSNTLLGYSRHRMLEGV